MHRIELLAEDIERQDLKHNLVAAKDSDKNCLISGYRRLEAVKFLLNEGRRKNTKVPCVINGEKSQAKVQFAKAEAASSRLASVRVHTRDWRPQ